MTDVLAAVVTRQPDLNRVPVRVRRLLQRCFERDPKRRLRDIGEARFLLEEAPADKKPQTVIPQKLAWVSAALLLIAFFTLAFVHFRETSALQPLMQFNVDLGPDAVVGPRVTATISPDGRRLVFVARGADGKTRIRRRTKSFGPRYRPAQLLR